MKHACSYLKFVCAFFCLYLSGIFTVFAADVTSHVELLGNPLLEQFPIGNRNSYARNVWDMQLFNGRLYFGSGNASDTGSGDSGYATRIRYYDMNTGTFEIEYDTLNSQLGNVSRIIDGMLLIPGWDPPSPSASLFRWENGAWKKTAAGGAYCDHAYDVYKFGNQYFSALGDVGAIRVSNNFTGPWQTATITYENGSPLEYPRGRAYTIFELAGNLYVSESDVLNRFVGGTSFVQLNQNKALGMFPGSDRVRRVVRPVNHGNKLVYLGATGVNDHQFDPLGLFVASAEGQATRVNLNGNAVPWDVLVKDGKCYVLGNIKLSSTSWIVTVSSSSDLNNWTELFRFDSDTLGRSFEIVNGDCYIGLGSESVETQTIVTASVGNILRIDKTHFSSSLSSVPAVPSNVQATPVWSTAVRVSWTDTSTNERGFRIQRKIGTGAYVSIAIVDANSTTFVDSGLTENSPYSYRIQSFNEAGSLSYSSEASCTTLVQTTVPSAPLSLKVEAVSNSQINLSWVDSSNDENGFRIERSLTGASNSYTVIETLAKGVAIFEDRGLSAGTRYYYRVCAFNRVGNSSYSNAPSATTFSGSTLPTAPSNLIATAASETKINLSWTDQSNIESGFKIERKISAAGGYDYLTSVGAGVTTLSNNALTPGTTYFYRVRATNSAGDSAFSNEASVTTPSGTVNQGPSVNAGSNQTITLPASASLNGTVTDDGLPSGILTRTWSRVSGPGTVTFANASAEDTTASFSVAGTYVLRLTATDGALTNSDDVTITVQGDTPPPSSVILGAIAGGESHSLAVKDDGTLWSWGLNAKGQLGLGHTNNVLAARQVSGFMGASEVVGGRLHSVVLKADGTVWAFGHNAYGQLGDGTKLQRTSPIQVSSLSGVGNIAAGDYHTLVLESDGTVWGWGNGLSGKLGDGLQTKAQLTPVKAIGLSGITQIAAGASHSIALKSDGSVWTWGMNRSGQLGLGYTNECVVVPTRVPGLLGVQQIVGGNVSTYALKSDGTVWSWGRNLSGQLGDGTSVQKDEPVRVAGLSGIVAIASGSTHGLALDSNGDVWAWGSGASGQIGDGDTTKELVPVKLLGLSQVVGIGAGGSHSMALKSDGRIYTWGANEAGQLGVGSTTDAAVPTVVSGVDLIQ
jgi:alpha-tubulin suppressor-like RCC1 family protein